MRNSAIIPNNVNNTLRRKSNIAGNANKSFKSSNTSNNIDSIKELPEDYVDHLKKFNDKDKNKNTKK